MAEYYPLLAKAVGSLSNSTSESRRIVYERARKALIGQLRTLHPPVPDEDIDRESEALDRAIERLEGELATGGIPAPTAGPPVPQTPPPAMKPTTTTLPVKAPVPKPPAGGEARPLPDAASSAAPMSEPDGSTKSPMLPLRNKLLGTKPAPDAPIVPVNPVSTPTDDPPENFAQEQVPDAPRPPLETRSNGSRAKASRGDGSRPIAPQPPATRAPKRRLWIIPVAVGLVVAVVAYFAWKLRDHPETIASKAKPAEQAQVDSGKIAERVGGPPPASPPPASQTATSSPAPSSSAPATQSQGQAPAPGDAPSQQAAVPAPSNPELPVAHRAALLVEAPSEPNKVKTFLGTVVWKLNNVPQGPNDAVGLAVEADIEIPDDKMKVTVTFAKNTEASLPASHTINIRYSIEAGSYTGDVKQISVPQMRPEASASGEPLAGVTVQIVPNSFLVGLSPGNAEAANTDLLRRLQWVDIPMLLDTGKIAKLTFEKSDSGRRDIAEALDAWQKP